MTGASITSQQVHVGDGESQQEESQEEEDRRDAKTQLLDAALNHVVGVISTNTKLELYVWQRSAM